MISCHANPDINGAAVPTVGSATDVPTCAQICARLQALCGYAPANCLTPDDDSGLGYCDTVLADDSVKICIGFGADDGDGGIIPTTSCELAWECVANAPSPYGGPDDDAATDDSGDQGDDSGDQGADDAGTD